MILVLYLFRLVHFSAFDCMERLGLNSGGSNFKSRTKYFNGFIHKQMKRVVSGRRDLKTGILCSTILNGKYEIK